MKKIALYLIFTCLSGFLVAQSVVLDPTFGVNGKRVTGLFGLSGNPYGKDFTALPDGGIIIGGRLNDFVGLEKYDNLGEQDPTFSSCLIESDALEIGIAGQKDGKVLMVAENTIGLSTFAARLDAFGNLDSSFGNGGIAQTHVSHFLIRSVFEQADGKVLVFGDEWTSNSSFSAVRLLSNGDLDSSFATNGKLSIDLPNYAYEVPVAMLEQADHKLIFAGSIGYPIWNILLVRVNPDGSLDYTFGKDGIIIDPIHGNSNAYALALQTDGKIVIAGDTGPDNQAVVVRYKSDGSRDTYFGEQGVQYLPEANEGIGIEIMPDGKILSANWTSNATLGNVALAQLMPDGQRDISFGINGVFRMIDPGMRPRALSLLGNKATMSARKPAGTTQKQIFRFLLDLNVGTLNAYNTADPEILCYPNPIAEQFTLAFELPVKEQVSLQLFDMNGKMVQYFVQNQSFEAGEHKLNLPCPGHLPAGNYILSLDVGGKKMRSVHIVKK